MKQLQLIAAFMVITFNAAYAQIGDWTPQYGAYHHINEYQGLWLDSSNPDAVMLTVYPHGSFTAPTGKITTIYTTGNCYNQPSSILFDSNYVVAMGYTGLTNFDSLTTHDSTQIRTMVAGLMQVVSVNSIKIKDTVTFPDMYPGHPHNKRMWVKIPLDAPFMYDPAQNLLVCIKQKQGENAPPTRFSVRVTYDSIGEIKTPAYNLQHEYLLIYNQNHPFPSLLQKRKVYMDLGFDLESTNVNDAYTAYKYRVYPNPTSVQLWVEGVDKIGNYEVYDMSSRLLHKGVGLDNKVSVAPLHQGLYILEFIKDKTLYRIRFEKQ